MAEERKVKLDYGRIIQEKGAVFHRAGWPAKCVYHYWSVMLLPILGGYSALDDYQQPEAVDEVDRWFSMFVYRCLN
jgi:hypothetical protein